MVNSEKNTYPFYHPFKSMITDIELDTETEQFWVREIIETYGETAFTNKFLADIKKPLSIQIPLSIFLPV